MNYGLFILAFSLSMYISVFEISNLSVVLIIVSLPLSLLISTNAKSNNYSCSLLVSNILFFSYIIFNNFLNGNNILDGVFWWSVLLVCTLFLTPAHRTDAELYLKTYLYSSLLVLYVDIIYRLKNPIVKDSVVDLGRYAYKYGLIDMDSNFAGIFSVFCFSTFLFMRMKRIKIKNIIGFLFFVSCVLSFSISAIISALVIFLYFIYLKFNSKTKELVIYFSIFFIFLSLGLIIESISSDGSGSSKLLLFSEGLKIIFSRDLYEFLFGVGLNQGDVMGVDPHLIYIRLPIELGLIGLLSFVLLIGSYSFVLKKDILFFLIPFLILGLSVVPISSPVLCASLLGIYFMKRTEYEAS
ncbi:hypothetical protein D3A87_17220 [Vibrio cholerae]|uniref:hypothetical protein n=2 Tax=Vibrio cholerae TaxID=666 RepID=UPI001E57D6F9|nr:hypothetical protein [Vibrio cholerae]MCD1189295.1 hypothetical protein [Vibrio cholerae]MCD1229691.1 hypothetical protein [Vibrio cholerae]